jgi:hypothetical protein
MTLELNYWHASTPNWYRLDSPRYLALPGCKRGPWPKWGRSSESLDGLRTNRIGQHMSTFLLS